MNNRLEILVNRLAKLSINHENYHAKCFGDGGIYDKLKSVMNHCSWDETKENKYLEKSYVLIDKIRTEILAINYFNAIIEANNSCLLIDVTTNNINKYGWLRVEVKTDNL